MLAAIHTLAAFTPEVLLLIIKEYTTQKIAEALFITAPAIEFHRITYCKNWVQKNSVVLVQVAMEKGLV
jgi:FixJ family two-component response regulator